MTPIKLREGRAIGAFNGFASSFNWLIDWLCNLVTDKWLTVSEDTPNHRTLKWNGKADEASLTVDGTTFAMRGFDSATDGQVPKKNASTGVIVWGSAGGNNLKFIGTDGSYAIAGDPSATEFNTVTFASASDSDVEVTVSGSGGNVVITMGVYYT